MIRTPEVIHRRIRRGSHRIIEVAPPVVAEVVSRPRDRDREIRAAVVAEFAAARRRYR